MNCWRRSCGCVRATFEIYPQIGPRSSRSSASCAILLMRYRQLGSRTTNRTSPKEGACRRPLDGAISRRPGRRGRRSGRHPATRRVSVGKGVLRYATGGGRFEVCLWWWAPRRRLLFCCSRPETTLALVSSCPEDGSEGFCRPPSANRGVDQKRAWSSASARSSTFGGNSSAYQQRFVTREFTWMETNATQPFFPRKTRSRSHRAEQLDST